jgi:hypothetical protein
VRESLLARGTRASKVDGRVVLLGIVAVYFSAVAVARAAFGVDLWPYLGVSSAPTLFYDARNVAAAADCWELGHDPLVSNPCDPAGRVMVYPRVWVLLHFVGLRQSATWVFGAIVVALFLASLWFLLGRISVSQGLIAALAVTSPAVMLAIERGNMDLVVFAMFVLAVIVWRRGEPGSLLSPALVLAAAIAKFYAIFGFLAFAFTGIRRVIWAVPAGLAIMILYVLFTIDDVRQVMSAPEGGLLYSYGARILIGNVYHRFVPGEWVYGNLLAQALAIIPVVVLTIVLWVWTRRRLGPLSAWERISPRVLSFHLGALTYLGTFAVRRNGDYRLIFLLLTLPLLLDWAAASTNQLRMRLARGGLLLVVAGLWVGALSPFIGPWDELASWGVAGIMVALLAATVPTLHLPKALAIRRGPTRADAAPIQTS